MNIIKTQITRTAEETTAEGFFQLEYTVSENILERVSATIRKAEGDEQPGDYLGSIVYEMPAVNFNFMNTGIAFAPLVVEFERLLEAIKSSLTGGKPSHN